VLVIHPTNRKLPTLHRAKFQVTPSCPYALRHIKQLAEVGQEKFYESPSV